MIRFHNEIIDFYEYIKPSEQIHEQRNKSIEKMKELIRAEFANAKVEVFGSHRTQLYLPSGDIDMVVIDENISIMNFQESLKEIFLSHKDYSKVIIIRSARVPIIKVIETKTNTSFDISLNKTEGLDQIGEINRALQIYPEMAYLIFVVKCFLKQRDLNETYSGGIGSFLLYCMILAFLRNYREELLKHENNLNNILLSQYLLKFFELYGVKFDCSKYLIYLNDGGSIKAKPENSRNQFTLINPLNNEQDLGSASFKIRDIFNIFRNRFNYIINYNFQKNESVLKCFLNPSLDDFSCDY